MTKQLLTAVISATGLALAAGTAVVLKPQPAFAQADAADDIENLFSKEEEEVEPAPAPAPTPKPGDEAQAPQPEIKEVSDLGKLQPFSDIAVISKRFLPKSNRFELYVAPALNLNDAFFLNFGGSARFGYYFVERYGIEAVATILTVTTRQVTDDLRNRGVTTSSFITPRTNYTLDFKWVPIYGKMTWRNEQITPFDLYFSGGIGLTGTNQGSNDMTLHLGTGQIFAISKSRAFRWDFSWYMFNSKSSIDPTGKTSLYHNLLITLGMSFFFPEATYR